MIAAAQIQVIYHIIKTVAPTNASVMITGGGPEEPVAR